MCVFVCVCVSCVGSVMEESCSQGLSAVTQRELLSSHRVLCNSLEAVVFKALAARRSSSLHAQNHRRLGLISECHRGSGLGQ